MLYGPVIYIEKQISLVPPTSKEAKEICVNFRQNEPTNCSNDYKGYISSQGLNIFFSSKKKKRVDV